MILSRPPQNLVLQGEDAEGKVATTKRLVLRCRDWRAHC